MAFELIPVAPNSAEPEVTVNTNFDRVAVAINELQEAGGGEEPGAGLPPGGTAGQFLAKVSATDGDATWVDPPAGGSDPGDGGGDPGGGNENTSGLSRAPLAAQFPVAAWGRGAAAGLELADKDLFGLAVLDTIDIPGGFSAQVRPIPAAMQAAFKFVARVRGSVHFHNNNGPGVIVTCGAGAARSIFVIKGHALGGTPGHGPYGGYWDGFSYTDLPFDRKSEFEWFRVEVVGTVVNLYVSQDAFGWSLYHSRDMGVPITHYGFVTHRGSAPKGAGRFTVPHFESTEFPAAIIAAGF